MVSWFVTYKRPMVPPAALSQIVTADQGCILTVEGPIAGHGLAEKAEIGRYEHKCPTESAARLRDLALTAAREVAAWKGPDSGRGTSFLVFGLGKVGGDVDSLAAFPLSQPLTPALLDFDTAMLAHARQLQESPIATLMGSATCAYQGGELSVELTWRNSGTARIQVLNPAAGADAQAIGLTLVVARDLPPGEEADEDPLFVEVQRGEVTRVLAADADEHERARARVRLQPEEQLVLSLRVARHLFIERGAWRCTLDCAVRADDAPEDEAVAGKLRIPAGSFTVAAKR